MRTWRKAACCQGLVYRAGFQGYLNVGQAGGIAVTGQFNRIHAFVTPGGGNRVDNIIPRNGLTVMTGKVLPQRTFANALVQAHHSGEVIIRVKPKTDTVFCIFIPLKAGRAARTRHLFRQLGCNAVRKSGIRRGAFLAGFDFRQVGHRACRTAKTHPATVIHPFCSHGARQARPQAVQG